MKEDVSLLECLSKLEHERWSHWMKYLFVNSRVLSDGSIQILPGLVRQLTRQMNTDYKDLSEEEKGSDRVWANKVMETIHKELGGFWG